MGKPLSEETKRKISEALKKNGTQQETGRSSEAQGLLDKFTADLVSYEDAKSQREGLMAKAKALGRKKASKKARAEINKQIAELTASMKSLRASMTATKNEASAKRLQKSASLNIAKAETRIKQFDVLSGKIKELISKTENPERKARLQARLERAMSGKTAQQGKITEYKAIQSGKVTKRTGAFNFHEQLADGPFKPYRSLTEQEQRVNFVRLDEMLTKQSDQFEEEMAEYTRVEIDRIVEAAKPKIDAWDVAAVAAIAFLLRGKVRDSVRKAIGTFYGIGTGLAMKELGLAGRPESPAIDKRLMAVDADAITEAYVSNLENTAKALITASIAVDAGADATATALRAKLKDEAAKTITNISGTITGQYLNRGRGSVFSRNAIEIVSYQRTEVLDGRTCAICRSIDERVVKPDDPMLWLHLVHTHCRGFWVPIFEADVEKPEVNGVPKTITDRFDTVDGRPVINSFKQLKKPVADASVKTRDKVRKQF